MNRVPSSSLFPRRRIPLGFAGMAKAAAVILVLAIAHSAAYADPETHLRSAAEAYTTRDWLRLSTEVKAAVHDAPEDPVVLQSATEIQERAYSAIGGGSVLPADFRLPSEITRLNIGLVRNLRRGLVAYRYAFQGSERTRGFVQDLRLERIGSQGAVIMLDRTLGDWEYDTIRTGEDPEFGLYGYAIQSPPTPGLYRVTVSTSSGVIQGTVLITARDISSADLQIESPRENEVFENARPTFRIQNLVTPQLRESDKRGVWVGVFALNGTTPNDNPPEVWSLWMSLRSGDTQPLSVTVGTSDGYGVPRLEPGNYMVRAKFTEQRRYGDLRISRNTGRNVNFSVR